MRKLLSGNEAIALGAYEGGVKVASAYPGTPSTEILENLVRYEGVCAEWAPNEKVALDVAIGAAYAGKRALAAMKHVGLNVASDALFYVAYTGMAAGLVIVTADDPGMHSSQNEQDNRNYAKFAKVPMLEPSDSSECRDFVGLALAISEEFDTPVLLRTSTRIAHTLTVVDVDDRHGAIGSADKQSFKRNPAKYVMVPAFARQRHPLVEARLQSLAEYAETFVGNRVEWGDSALGIVSGGISYQYAREVFPYASFLKLGMSYPLPERKVREFCSHVERVLVVEDLDPFWEEQIRLLGIEVEGKKFFPSVGEFSPEAVREGARKAGLLVAEAPVRPIESPPLPARPPILCVGCRHRGVFYVLNKLKAVVNGDIGCYTLGVVPPLSAVDTTGCMGASIGNVHGVDKAGIVERSVAVIGDSTFLHSGIAPLMNVVYNKGTSVTIILDNRTTAMTGHQEHAGTGKTLLGNDTVAINIPALVRALGVEDVRVVDPWDLKEVEAAIRAGLATDKPAVIVTTGSCVLKSREKHPIPVVNLERCNGCDLCLRVGCPGVIKLPSGKVEIDDLQCIGCALCVQTCARKALAVPSRP
ncbi:MAG: indolepyruvate ferredoxin oxidoreductase subunit alpha [Chloroflexi bacterium]|nr:indolepyruvate ferredoxin oxidoreductase subunit alpha [Chloroflexota bacterium]